MAFHKILTKITMTTSPDSDMYALDKMISNQGKSIGELSDAQPVLLVFLRHFGCTFCREALSELSQLRSAIEEMGVQIVAVHMTEDEIAERYFNRYGLEGIAHVSDPDCVFYQKFGLVKGSFTQLFGLHSWIRGFSAGVVQGHGVGVQLGDGFQMPGVFVIGQGKILTSFVHKLASDRPDYLGLVEKALEGSKAQSV